MILLGGHTITLELGKHAKGYRSSRKGDAIIMAAAVSRSSLYDYVTACKPSSKILIKCKYWISSLRAQALVLI